MVEASEQARSIMRKGMACKYKAHCHVSLLMTCMTIHAPLPRDTDLSLVGIVPQLTGVYYVLLVPQPQKVPRLALDVALVGQTRLVETLGVLLEQPIGQRAEGDLGDSVPLEPT